MALLLNEPWTGTGSWPTGNWTNTYTGSGASSSIFSNKGRLTVPTADAVIEWADDVVLGADYDVRCSLVFSANADYDGRVYIATEFSTGAFSGNGHYVWLNPADDTLGIGTVVGYSTSTPVGSTTYTFSNTDTVYVHVKVRGSACWVRAWKNAEDEPLTWQLTGTLTYTFDEIHLGAEGLGGSGSVDFDDLVVYSNKMVTKTIDTGWAGAGDLIVLSHASPTWAGPVKVIIWKHGGVGGSAEEVDDYDLWPEVISDANGRYVLYAADDGFGGNGAAGNDTELGSIDAVYARAQTDEPDFPRVALAAHSLGGMGIVNWAYRNATDVAGMVGVDAILDAAQQNTNDGGSFVTNVLDPAYGGSGTWATNASTRDPEELATASADLRAIPFDIYDATGDSTLSSNVMSNYVTAHGANATRTTIASGDHSTVHNFIPETDVIAFLEGLDFTAPAIGLVIDDATSATAIDNVVLGQAHVLVIADATSATAIDNVVLTAPLPGYRLAQSGSGNRRVAQSGGTNYRVTQSGAPTGATALVIDDATSAAEVDNVVLVQHHVLAIADATSATAVDNVTLGQAHTLAIADATSATEVDNVTLVQHHVLAIADATSATAIDAVTLTQAHVLVITDATSATAIDNVTLGVAGALVIDDATSATEVDNVTLVQHHVLTIADATSATEVDAVVLVQHHVLAIADATSATAVDSVVLGQVHVLAIDDATSATAVDNVVLGIAGQLGIDDATSQTAIDAVTLVQHHVLAIADATSATAIDELVLTHHHVLVIADATSSAEVDNVTLASAGQLTIADATSVATIDAVVLGQAHVLVIADATVTTAIDSIGTLALTLDPTVLPPLGFVVTTRQFRFSAAVRGFTFTEAT